VPGLLVSQVRQCRPTKFPQPNASQFIETAVPARITPAGTA